MPQTKQVKKKSKIYATSELNIMRSFDLALYRLDWQKEYVGKKEMKAGWQKSKRRKALGNEIEIDLCAYVFVCPDGFGVSSSWLSGTEGVQIKWSSLVAWLPLLMQPVEHLVKAAMKTNTKPSV